MYNITKSTNIVVKLVQNSDWIKFVDVELDEYGFHYLLVKLNKTDDKMEKNILSYYVRVGFL